MAKKRMTKSEFVGAIAKKSGLEKKQVTAALTALNEVVYKELSKGARRSGAARPDQAGHRQEARRARARRHQSLHRSARRLQGQARQQGREGPPRQAAQGRHQVVSALETKRPRSDLPGLFAATLSAPCR